jgi:CTP:molybdopterin cytidylyltransferase MocA
MGRPKALLPLGEGTILSWTCGILASESRVVVVANPDTREAVEAALRGADAPTGAPETRDVPGADPGGPAALVVNPRPEDGMFSSVRLGLARVGDAGAVLVTPVDCVPEGAGVMRALLRAWEAEPSLSRVLVPVVGAGQRGHPVLIPGPCIAALLAMPDCTRFSEALESVGVAQVPVSDRWILLNVNTPDDYNRLLERHAAAGGRP